MSDMPEVIVIAPTAAKGKHHVARHTIGDSYRVICTCETATQADLIRLALLNYGALS